MPRCGCQDACSCLIVAGDGISVEGIGTLERPYEITSESSDLVGRIEFTDEGNVDFTVTGVGTLNDPTTVFADAQLAVTDLIDVDDPTPPVEGDVLVWRIDHWEFEQQSGGSGVPPGGTDGQVLTKQSSADGDAAWETITGGGGGGAAVEPVYASSRRHAAATAIPNSSITPIAFDTLDYEDGIPWNGADFVIPVDGYYQINAAATTNTMATGGPTLRLIINGSASVGGLVNQSPGAANGSAGPTAHLHRTVKLKAGDLVHPSVSQISGSASALAGGVSSNWVNITKVPALAPGGGGVIIDRPVTTSRRQAAMVPCANGATVTIPWDTEDFTEGGIGFAGGIFTVPTDGYYLVNVKVNWEGNTAGYRQIRLGVSGTSNTAGIFTATPNATAVSGVTEGYGRVLKCVAGDAISCVVNQTSGVTLNAGGASNYTSIDITRLPTAYSGSAVSTYGEQVYAAARAHSVATSIPNAAVTPIPFNTAAFAETGIPWNGVDGFTAPVSGFYQVDLMVTYAGVNTTGVRGAFLTVNGNGNSSSVTPPASGTQVCTVTCGATLWLDAGNILRGCAYQTSGAALALSGNAAYTRMTVHKVPAPVINGAAASGVWGAAPLETSLYGTNDLIGREIYIDSKGQLRTKPAGGEMGGAVDLNTMDRTGQWSQTQNGDAASGLNYPVPLAGMLEVVTNDGYNGSMTWQRYTTYASGVDGGGAVYTRGRYNGVWAGWVCTSGPGQPFASASGVSTLAASVAAGVGVSLAISYPVGRFSVAPIVVASADSNGYGVASAAGSSQTGCTLRYYNPTASVHSTCKVHWIATQMTPTSATG